MGDQIVISEIKIIYNGLFQIDLRNTSTNEQYRVFAHPDSLFSMIGSAMENNYNKYMEDNFNKQKI